MPPEQAERAPYRPTRRCATSGLTVAEVARRFRVGEARVRTWIRRGELDAINTADAKRGKPRFVVLPDALAAFERGRRAPPPEQSAPKRKRRLTGVIDFFPD